MVPLAWCSERIALALYVSPFSWLYHFCAHNVYGAVITLFVWFPAWSYTLYAAHYDHSSHYLTNFID